MLKERKGEQKERMGKLREGGKARRRRGRGRDGARGGTRERKGRRLRERWNRISRARAIPSKVGTRRWGGGGKRRRSEQAHGSGFG